MAATVIVNDTTKITTGAISTWQVRSGATAGDGVVSFGELSDARITLEAMGRAATRQNPWPHAFVHKATAKVLGTAKANCLQKLNLLNQYINTHLITLVNGQMLGGSGGTSWRFVCEGGYEADRYLEIVSDIAIPRASGSGIDFAAFWDPSAQTAATSADPLYGFAPGAPVSAGWYSIQIQTASNEHGALNHFRNSSFIVEPVTTQDAHGQTIQYGCKAVVGFDWMQTDETGDLDVMDTIMGNYDIDIILTLADGAVFTMPGMGLKVTYNAGGNMDEIAFMRVELTKTYTPAEFVALIS